MSHYQQTAASPIDAKDKLIIAMARKADESAEPLQIPAGTGCQTIRIRFYALKKKLARLGEAGAGDREVLKLMEKLTLTIKDGVLTVGNALHTGGFGSLGEFLGGAEKAIASVKTQEEVEQAERLERMLQQPEEVSETTRRYRGE